MYAWGDGRHGHLQRHPLAGDPVQHLVEVAQNYRAGVFSGTNDVVETITGTPALSVAAFIDKNRKAFA